MTTTTRRPHWHLSDRDLLVALYTANQEISYSGCGCEQEEAELATEVDARFGGGASERLADYVTASRMAPAEAIIWAASETDLAVEIADGSHTHRINVNRLHRACCRCGWAPQDV